MLCPSSSPQLSEVVSHHPLLCLQLSKPCCLPVFSILASTKDAACTCCSLTSFKSLPRCHLYRKAISEHAIEDNTLFSIHFFAPHPPYFSPEYLALDSHIHLSAYSLSLSTGCKLYESILSVVPALVPRPGPVSGI